MDLTLRVLSAFDMHPPQEFLDGGPVSFYPIRVNTGDWVTVLLCVVYTQVEEPPITESIVPPPRIGPDLRLGHHHPQDHRLQRLGRAVFAGLHGNAICSRVNCAKKPLLGSC